MDPFRPSFSITVCLIINVLMHLLWASLVAQLVKNLPAMPQTWAPSLGWEDPLEKEVGTHSSILAWRIPWTEESGRLHTVHGVAKSWTRLSAHTHTYTHRDTQIPTQVPELPATH